MTQFMQVVKPEPSPMATMFSNQPEKRPKKPWTAWFEIQRVEGVQYYEITNDYSCPFGKVGDVIYCREKWNFIYGIIDTEWEPIGYYHSTDGDINKKWKSPATMPRDAARLFLRITNIRVMRAQELTNKDAKAHGVIIDHYGGFGRSGEEWRNYQNKSTPCRNAIESLKTLLGNIWGANQWHWIIDFEKTDKP